MQRLIIFLVFFGSFFFLGPGLTAQDSETAPPPLFFEYRGIRRFDPLRQWDESSKKVELIYFFWYGCPTCAGIDQKVSEMAAALPEGITFKMVPAPWQENSELTFHAKLFWALEVLGLERKLHSKVFSTVFPDGDRGPANLFSSSSQEAFAIANQIPVKDFNAALESPFVRNMLEKTADYLRRIGLDSLPAFVVNGKFLVPMDPRLTEDQFLSAAFSLAVHELIAQEAASPEAPAGPAASLMTTPVPSNFPLADSLGLAADPAEDEAFERVYNSGSENILFPLFSELPGFKALPRLHLYPAGHAPYCHGRRSGPY
ncbi:MAG: thiol:disulfide interchange protein DsbA/DsbL [Deltaproteobacteria bacterium]|jgi:thiol-disulfide isomerase/thioredoxin|nr:thiol:disulfide interchange protein DsbA/DsbL [Deltaproteobacteria bacterium]